MTTAEKYRQLEKSPSINIARYIFSCIKTISTNSTLGDEIIEIKTGKTPSKQNKRFYEDEYLNWFKPDEIGSEKYLFDAKDKLSKYAFENNQATIYEPDTILINAIGDVGRISILKVKASSNQQITGIRLNEKIDVNYAYFYLLANRQFFYVDLFQTTLPIVNQKKICSIPFVYPDIEEQRNIVEGLVEIDKINSVDDLYIIEKLNWNEDYKNACRNFFNVQFNSKNISTELTHQLTLVKKLRQQLLQDAVQGKLVKKDQSRKFSGESASDLLKKIKAEKEKLIAEKKLKKEKELPPIKPEEIPFEIPENWEWCKMNGICNFITDGDHQAPPQGKEGVPFIVISNIKNNQLRFEDTRFVSSFYYNNLSNEKKPQNGDILYTVTGSFGIPVILENIPNFCVQRHIGIIKPNRFISNKWLYYLLKSPFLYKQASVVAWGIAQRTIPLQGIRNFITPLPPLTEQNRIVQKLDELMRYCNDLEASIKQSQQQNEKLLQQVLREALRGKERRYEGF
jgi:type I restriction enzyme S subunit